MHLKQITRITLQAMRIRNNINKRSILYKTNFGYDTTLLFHISIGFNPLNSSCKPHKHFLAVEKIKRQMSTQKQEKRRRKGYQTSSSCETWELFPHQQLGLFVCETARFVVPGWPQTHKLASVFQVLDCRHAWLY